MKTESEIREALAAYDLLAEHQKDNHNPFEIICRETVRHTLHWILADGLQYPEFPIEGIIETYRHIQSFKRN